MLETLLSIFGGDGRETEGDDSAFSTRIVSFKKAPQYGAGAHEVVFGTYDRNELEISREERIISFQ